MLVVLRFLILSICAVSLSAPVQAHAEELKIEGSTITIQYDAKFAPALEHNIRQWVKNSATAVSRYYHGFPVQKCKVLVHAEDGSGVGVSEAKFDHCEIVIDVPLGIGTSTTELREDWILAHEMTHLAFPLVTRKDRWLVEGMATYVEPFARMHVGLMSVAEVWEDLVKRCPDGQPRNSTETLANSRRIDRIYWGGASFCLLADMELRKQSNNRFGLQDALAAICKDGANFESELSARQALALGDKALKTNILVSLYDRFANSSAQIDVNSIFKSLGVNKQGSKVIFDDAAPLAGYRKKINRGAE